MVRIGFERALIPDLREFVVAELAIGITDQIGDIRGVIVAQRPELIDGGSVVVTVVNRRIGRLVALNEGGVAEEGLPGGLLCPMVRVARASARSLAIRRIRIRLRRPGRRAHGILATAATAASAATTATTGGKGRDHWHTFGNSYREENQRHQPDRKSGHAFLPYRGAG